MMMVSVSYTNANAQIANTTENVGTSLETQIGEIRINPHFEPDESCMFDAYQLHCIPGEDQTCPKGYGGNEHGTCFLTHKGGCPEGYHSVDEDETGQCYPNEEECPGTMVFIEGGDDEYPYGDRCTPLYTICDDAEHRGEDYCVDYLQRHNTN